MERYTKKVEEGKPAVGSKPACGPAYRSVYARNGLLELQDDIHSPWDLFSKSVNRCPQNQMLGRPQIVDGKVNGYLWQTYEEVYAAALSIGSSLRNLGIKRGSTCGIYGFNCPEWVISMEACASEGIVYVPLYDTLGPNAVEFIINHADITTAFVQENKVQGMLDLISNGGAHLKVIISFGEVKDAQQRKGESLGVSCFSWKRIVSMGREITELPERCKDDSCTIMYTSGTTGDPKGVIIQNKAVLAEVMTTDYLLEETDKAVTENDSYFSYLPLAHIFDQTMINYMIYKGASIGFWRGDPRFLMDDVQKMRPTVFCGVPRVFDRIYAGVNQKVAGSGLISKILYYYAFGHKLRNLKKGLKQDEASPFFDNLVFSKIKQVFGGQVRLLISGAAPLPSHVEEFLRVASCSAFTQGYGLTESCGGCFSSIVNDFSMVGNVGPPVTTVDVRLESVPEMDYDAFAKVPRGEICLRGITLFAGYHKRPDLTNEVFSDGWFHTGDIGEWQANGTMKIIDRKKNIFKLSQGEYVAVEAVESKYMQCPLVTAVWVYGNSFESFLVGVVVPEREALNEWAASQNIAGSYEDLCKDAKARKHIMDEMNSTGRRLGLRGFEMLKAVHLEPVPFGIENDLVTPTFKLKRPQLLKFYRERVDELYCEAKAAGC